MGYADEDEVVETVDEAGDAAAPAWVNEGTDQDDEVIEAESDVSDAKPMESSDVIAPAKNVVFVINKVVIDTYVPKDGPGTWKTKSLKFYMVIEGEKEKSGGVDGKGKYAGKNFFPRMCVAVNRKDYDFSVNSQGKPTTWYAPKTGGAFGDWSSLLKALQFDPANVPPIDKAFRDSLIGRRIVADIEKNRAEIYNKDTGKSVRSKDEYENRLVNYRPAKARPQEVAAAAVTEVQEATEAAEA